MAALVIGLLAPALHAQAWGTSGTTTLSVSVGAEAAIYVNTGNTGLTTTTSIFDDYTGTTNFTYKIRTGKDSGTGAVQLQVTTDFTGNGPSVGSARPGDVLTYTCNVSTPGTGCSTAQTASTTAQTSVATFSANARSAKAGNSGSVGWTLTNNPQYETGTYTATVTFTISST